MRRRRDSFGRQSFIPQRARGEQCAYCGQKDPLATVQTERDVLHKCYTITVESDGGRVYTVGHPIKAFCSWSCAEAYTGSTFPK